MGSIGLVVPVLNQFKMAVDCIASAKSDQRKIQTYVIPNYRLGIPLSAAWNMGIDQVFSAGHEYALVCNDDVLFAPYTIDALYWAAKVGSHAVVTAQNVRGAMPNPDSILTMPEGYDSGVQLNPQFGGGPDFACFMIGWTAWNHIGRFDENFVPAYFEDNDYHRRVILSGMEAASVNTAQYYHYGSQTQNADSVNPVVRPEAFVRNRNHYIVKWGGEPGLEAFYHPYNDPSKTWRDW
jgi:GT2 family glycosyltransferase